jgi:hypothetical protein
VVSNLVSDFVLPFQALEPRQAIVHSAGTKQFSDVGRGRRVGHAVAVTRHPGGVEGVHVQTSLDPRVWVVLVDHSAGVEVAPRRDTDHLTLAAQRRAARDKGTIHAGTRCLLVCHEEHVHTDVPGPLSQPQQPVFQLLVRVELVDLAAVGQLRVVLPVSKAGLTQCRHAVHADSTVLLCEVVLLDHGEKFQQSVQRSDGMVVDGGLVPPLVLTDAHDRVRTLARNPQGVRECAGDH